MFLNLYLKIFLSQFYHHVKLVRIRFLNFRFYDVLSFEKTRVVLRCSCIKMWVEIHYLVSVLRPHVVKEVLFFLDGSGEVDGI